MMPWLISIQVVPLEKVVLMFSLVSFSISIDTHLEQELSSSSRKSQGPRAGLRRNFIHTRWNILLRVECFCVLQSCDHVVGHSCYHTEDQLSSQWELASHWSSLILSQTFSRRGSLGFSVFSISGARLVLISSVFTLCSDDVWFFWTGPVQYQLTILIQLLQIRAVMLFILQVDVWDESRCGIFSAVFHVTMTYSLFLTSTKGTVCFQSSFSENSPVVSCFPVCTEKDFG